MASTPDEDDQHQLTPMVDAVEADMDGKRPNEVSADAGYCSDANLAAMEGRAIDATIAAEQAEHPTDGEGGSKRMTDMREKIKAGGRASRIACASNCPSGVRAGKQARGFCQFPDARARQGEPPNRASSASPTTC